uniref:Ig-like domain-containing protein n=1 Tax=Pelusios castaneus TaxID=367368 RepID=A0A8C8ST21_9SAUR
MLRSALSCSLLLSLPGPSATSQKSKLTLDPPWSTVFLSECVTLTCNGSPSPARDSTLWYHNDMIFTSQTNRFRIAKVQMSDAGRYQCKAPGSVQSNPIQLTVSNEWLILQAPYYVIFEGDLLHLRCHGWHGAKVSEIRYYRDGREVTSFYGKSELFIEKAKTSDSGRYWCTGSMKIGLKRKEREELFSTPVLRAADPAEPTEGNPVTLTCVTLLNPQKSDMQLQCIFYKDGWPMTTSGNSLDYRIPAAQLEDSGSYYCVMQTMTLSVRKRSRSLNIAVKRIPVSGVSLGVQPLGGQVTKGERLVLSCSVAKGTGLLTFFWHRQGSRQALRNESQRSHTMDYEIPAATENDAGEYYCTVTNGNAAMSSPGVKVAVKGELGPRLLKWVRPATAAPRRWQLEAPGRDVASTLEGHEQSWLKCLCQPHPPGSLCRLPASPHRRDGVCDTEPSGRLLANGVEPGFGT